MERHQFRACVKINLASNEKTRSIKSNATGKRHYAHVDMPGDRNYIANMITGLAQVRELPSRVQIGQRELCNATCTGLEKLNKMMDKGMVCDNESPFLSLPRHHWNLAASRMQSFSKRPSLKRLKLRKEVFALQQQMEYSMKRKDNKSIFASRAVWKRINQSAHFRRALEANAAAEVFWALDTVAKDVRMLRMSRNQNRLTFANAMNINLMDLIALENAACELEQARTTILHIDSFCHSHLAEKIMNT
jgi:hypothetical protein